MLIKMDTVKKFKTRMPFNQDLADRILAGMVDGDTVSKILRSSSDMPNRLMLNFWAGGEDGAPQEFVDMYNRARHAQVDGYADDTINIADGTDKDADAITARAKNMAAKFDVSDATVLRVIKRDEEARMRLRIQSRQWIAERISAGKYGSKLNVEHNVPDPIKTVDLSKLSDEDLDKMNTLLEAASVDGS